MAIIKKCIECGNEFTARQANYKACSKACSKAYYKISMREFYKDNRESIIVVNSARAKANNKPKVEMTCKICEVKFLNSRNAKCCSKKCRTELNRRECRRRYGTPVMSPRGPLTKVNKKSTCKICGEEFMHVIKRGSCSDTCSRKRRARKARHRYKTDINFRLADILRSRLKNVLKGRVKKGSAVSDLGCSIEELKKHLESRFTEGMTWENYGKGGWEIDHIIPLSKVDLQDLEELKKVCHYSNLQPLWAGDNRSKGNRT